MAIECKCENCLSWESEEGDYFGYCLENDDETDFDAWCLCHRMDWDKQKELDREG